MTGATSRLARKPDLHTPPCLPALVVCATHAASPNPPGWPSWLGLETYLVDFTGATWTWPSRSCSISSATPRRRLPASNLAGANLHCRPGPHQPRFHEWRPPAAVSSTFGRPAPHPTHRHTDPCGRRTSTPACMACLACASCRSAMRQQLGGPPPARGECLASKRG